MKNYGIKSGYPRLRKKFGKLLDYVALCRPFTLVAPALAGFFGVLIQLASYNELDYFWVGWREIIYVAVTLMLCQSVGQILNQSADVEADEISRSYRPIPSGRITKDEAIGFAWILALFAVARAFTINLNFGIIIVIILFFAVFYNIQPIRSKRPFPINLLWMSISRGLLPFLATWVVFGTITDIKPWLLGCIATTWVISFQSTKDFPDLEADKKFGIKTLPVVFGNQSTQVMSVLSLIPFSLAAIFIGSGLLSTHYVLVFILIPFALVILRSLNRPSSITENTISWMTFYIGLGILYLISFVAEVI